MCDKKISIKFSSVDFFPQKENKLERKIHNVFPRFNNLKKNSFNAFDFHRFIDDVVDIVHAYSI